MADDSLENMWRVVPTSFVNMGRDHRPRCWPWSDENELPYGRNGVDKPLRGGSGPNGKMKHCTRATEKRYLFTQSIDSCSLGAISVHICVGPHGCTGKGQDGKEHPHSYQAHAA